MKKAFGLLVGVLFFGNAFSQTGKISTVVVDELNQTMPGVNVYLENSTTGKPTNIDGVMELTVEPGNYTLVYKFAAYKTQTVQVKIDAGKTMKLVMHMLPQDYSVLENTSAMNTTSNSKNTAEDPKDNVRAQSVMQR